MPIEVMRVSAGSHAAVTVSGCADIGVVTRASGSLCCCKGPVEHWESDCRTARNLRMARADVSILECFGIGVVF
jgi:hypothetical protein